MTFLETIKPHLLSDDLLVQETVLHALHDFPNVPEDWTVQLLKEAFENSEKLTSILIYARNQTISEEAVKVFLEHIPHMDKNNVHLALRFFEYLEPHLAVKYRDQLKDYIQPDKWELYDLLINGEEERVYMEYGKTLNDLEWADSYQHKLFVKAKILAKCIVQNGWVTEDEIDIVLQQELNGQWFTYNGILTVYMVGLWQLEKHIPILVGLLGRDEDVLVEEVTSALILFQSDEVVKEVAPYLTKNESIIFATSVVENIKTDFSVKVLRDAYHQVEELDDQDLIIEALCHLLSKKALPEIEEHMKKEFHSNLVDIEQVVYGYYSILGVQHPELDDWRQIALESELNYIEERNSDVPFISEMVKTENKVGRNDPCPCGSGKKYKKCCG
jgi:hypothetical protein